jgi:hypothetical protein
MNFMNFNIVSEEKSIEISGQKMLISRLVEFWLEALRQGYRIVDSRGGYVAKDGSYLHERSYVLTVSAPLRMLSQLKLLARGIALLANQEEVWIEYGKHRKTITKTANLRTSAKRHRPRKD